MPAIALISDIHGNLPALEAVAADVAARRPDAVYVLGDMVNGCPWSAETLDMLAALGWPMLQGNHDDAVLQLGTPRMEPRYGRRERYAALWWTREHLTDAHIACLEALPRELTLALPDAPPLRLLHGIPGNFFIGFRPNGDEIWAAGRLQPVTELTVVGGHTHCPMVRQIGRWLVVNDGSVGSPYDGDTRASYAWLESASASEGGEAAGWHAEVRRVTYDLDAVDAGFRTSGMLDEGGVTAELFRRSVLTGVPWVSDFLWWMRDQPAEALADMWAALAVYDTRHGPGHWAFPYA
jgi:predicted phosphodiesterase